MGAAAPALAAGGAAGGMGTLGWLGLGAGLGGAASSLFGGMMGGGQTSAKFTPFPYNEEKSAVNPRLWAYLNTAMEGKTQDEDWQGLNATMAHIRQNYLDSLKANAGNFAGRGIFDSGWFQKRKGELLGQRAGQESGATSNMYQNILNRQLGAQDYVQQLLANARAGGGTYKFTKKGLF